VVRFIGRRAGSASVPVVLQRVAFDFVHFFIFAFTPLSGLLLPARVYCLRRWPSTRSSSGFTPARYFFLFFCTPFSLGPSFYSFSASFVVHFFPSRRRALLLLSPKARYEFKKKREQVHDEAPENAFIKEPTRIPFQTRVSRKKDEGLAQRCRRLFVFVFAFRCAAIRTAAAWTRCRRSARRCPTASRWPPAPPRRRRRRRRRPRAPPLRPRRP